MARPARPLEERFWKKVDRSSPDGCWLWMGAKRGKRGTARGGYGQIQVGYRSNGKQLMESAHRVGYLLQVGPIPPGRYICHHCDNPMCVRGDHLYAGTHVENMADMATRSRAAAGDRHGTHTHPERIVRGEQHWKAKLTDAQVREMRARYAAGATYAQLGRDVNVSKPMARFAVLGHCWTHIDGAASQSRPPAPKIIRPAALPIDRTGERNGNARLTEADVRAMRERASNGETYAQLGRAFGVTSVMARLIVQRKNWKHVA